MEPSPREAGITAFSSGLRPGPDPTLPTGGRFAPSQDRTRP